MSELNPCYRCGNAVQLSDYWDLDSWRHYSVACKYCGVSTTDSIVEMSAVNEWNSFPTEIQKFRGEVAEKLLIALLPDEGEDSDVNQAIKRIVYSLVDNLRAVNVPL